MSTHSLNEAVLSFAGFTAALTCLHSTADQASGFVKKKRMPSAGLVRMKGTPS